MSKPPENKYITIKEVSLETISKVQFKNQACIAKIKELSGHRSFGLFSSPSNKKTNIEENK